MLVHGVPTGTPEKYFSMCSYCNRQGFWSNGDLNGLPSPHTVAGLLVYLISLCVI